MDQKTLEALKRARASREKLEQSADDLAEAMRRVFKKRVELNQAGHLGDVVRGQ